MREETNERFLLRKKKEEKEIARLLKEKNKPKITGYIFYFVFIITIVYLVDEVSTNIGKLTETIIAEKFFSMFTGRSASVKQFADVLIMIAAGLGMLFRPLSDRYGRKLFLVLYTLGMGLGMFIIGIATSIPVWAIGSMLIQFCIPHDMQQVYIQECAPQEKRGTYYSIIKCLATLGILLIPLFRSIFKVDVTDNGWRNVYFVLGMVGVVISVVALIFMRESDAYIDNRLKQLMMTEEERQKAKEEKSDEAKRGGIINGLKHIFIHKQLLWIALSYGFIMIAYQLTNGYNTIIAYGYLNGNGLIDASGAIDYSLSESFVTRALTLYALSCAIVELFPGIIADKIGRKKASIFFAVGTVLFYVLFYISTVFIWNPYIIGLLIGAACGSIWSYGDLMLLMISESTETNLRVSTNTTTYLVSGSFYGAAIGIFSIITLILGDKSIAPVTLALVLIGITIGTILMLLKVKETKGIDISSISAKSFETEKEELNV